MRIGFVVERRAQEIEVQISAPDNNDQSALVTYSRVGDSFALLMGHLYYRLDRLAELLAACPQHNADVWLTNDAALILALYRHLGMGALERLEGDFALVLWDAEANQLIAQRDPLGGYPLFWIQHEDTLALSTNMRPLCALLPHCTLNEAYFADFVMMQEPRHEALSEQCVYVGLHRVLPGTLVIARADSDQIERRPYWDWLKHIQDPGTSDVAEVAEQYRTLLRAAVRERMRGTILAHLSGGMDSTSVALLARDLVVSGIRRAPIHTVSQIYERLPLLAGERAYIESALQDKTALVAHRLISDDLLDFNIFTNPPLHDEPYPVLPSGTAGLYISALAISIGADSILTGHGSDEIHSRPPYLMADLLRQYHFRQAWQEASRWAKASNHGPWRILSSFGIQPIVSQWVAGSRWASLLPKKEGDWSVPAWIRPEFARHHDLRGRARENARQFYQQSEQTLPSMTLRALQSRAGDAIRWSMATPLGMTRAHPFLDPRLLTFGLGIQSRIEPVPGQPKQVLVEAMRGILPDMIRYRQRKQGCNEVYYLGLARNLPVLEVLVQQAPTESMIDKDLLIDHLREGRLAGIPPRGLQHATYMLSLLKWLSMQKEWLQVHEKVTHTDRIAVSGGVK